MLNTEMAPLLTFWPKYGSHRRPPLSVTRLGHPPRILPVEPRCTCC